jgi:cell cycle serine/threonine-protein kinase CDC5/MSD2
MPSDLDMLGPYRIDKHVEDGALSLVRRCVSPKGRKVIAKIYDQSESSRKIFSNEVGILESFKKRSIIRCLESFESNGQAVLILQYGGENLFDFLSRANPTQAQVRNFAQQMFKAVKDVHDAGIIHGDIKLENFVISSRETIRLIDFGSAERIPEGGTSTAVCGSQFYRPPELIRRKPHDRKVDIWALGITLFALAMHKFPFSSDRLDHDCDVCLEPPSTDNAEEVYGPAFVSLIVSMLAKNPNARPTIEQCLQHQWFEGAIQNV